MSDDDWISVENRLPEDRVFKRYRVKTREGSISPHENERVTLGRMTPTGFRFNAGNCDWVTVTHWKEFEED